MYGCAYLLWESKDICVPFLQMANEFGLSVGSSVRLRADPDKQRSLRIYRHQSESSSRTDHIATLSDIKTSGCRDSSHTCRTLKLSMPTPNPRPFTGGIFVPVPCFFNDNEELGGLSYIFSLYTDRLSASF